MSKKEKKIKLKKIKRDVIYKEANVTSLTWLVVSGPWAPDCLLLKALD